MPQWIKIFGKLFISIEFWFAERIARGKCLISFLSCKEEQLSKENKLGEPNLQTTEGEATTTLIAITEIEMAHIDQDRGVITAEIITSREEEMSAETTKEVVVLIIIDSTSNIKAEEYHNWRISKS